MAQHFYLRVSSAQVGQRKIPNRAANPVPGAIIDVRFSRWNYKRRGRLFRVLPITKGHLWSIHEELALFSWCHLVQILVSHQNIHTRMWIADRHNLQLRFARGAKLIPAVKSAGYRQFGWSVEVFQDAVGGGFLPRGGQGDR